MYSWPFYLDVAEGGTGVETAATRARTLEQGHSAAAAALLLLQYSEFCSVMSYMSVSHPNNRHPLTKLSFVHLCVFVSICASPHIPSDIYSVCCGQSAGLQPTAAFSNEMRLCCHFRFVYTSRTTRGGGTTSKHLNVQAQREPLQIGCNYPT